MADTETGLFIDGTVYTVDDLSYREQRKMRELARELAPDGELDAAGEIDLIPAMVCVLRRRTEPSFSLEQALDVKPKDLEQPVPPTRTRRKS